MCAFGKYCRLALLTLFAPAWLATASAQDGLPLPRGYYVNTETDCGSASGETIMLWHGNGFNIDGVMCSFTGLTDEGSRIWGFRQDCKDLANGTRFTEVGELEVLGAEKMRIYVADWEAEMRYCPQAKLPKPWRTNNLSQFMD